MGTLAMHRVGRRWVLVLAGRGAVGLAVLGLAACGGSNAKEDASGTASSPVPSTGGASGDGNGLAWSRVDLGFVAAYVLVRGGRAAVVDTGVAGSADAIGSVLDSAGPGWAGVRHVVLTHKHPDHAGSIDDVLSRASGAVGYVGAADLADVDSDERLRPLADGDDVFGLQMVGTPGHTVGHMSVFDTATKVLLAGDALNNTDGLAGSNPQFTEDKDAAVASVRTLADLRPRTILVGHGDPVVRGAADALQRLAASLG
jgi:glyoxylase-like metal-dependent hydrolase (beta-lactamase superfamily II)